MKLRLRFLEESHAKVQRKFAETIAGKWVTFLRCTPFSPCSRSLAEMEVDYEPHDVQDVDVNESMKFLQAQLQRSKGVCVA